jgi:hypothetical protein
VEDRNVLPVKGKNMNRLLIAVLTASLAGPVLSSPAAASQGFPEEAWMVARKGGDEYRQEDRDPRKSKQQSGKKKQDRAEDEDKDRGYGYGYERRSLDRPDRVYDDRGRH